MAVHPADVQGLNQSSPEWKEPHHEILRLRDNRRQLADLTTSDNVTSAHGGPQPWQYEICVRGHLGDTMCSAFPALRAQARGRDTVLTGTLSDQAALYGVLAEIEALGLELLEVRRLLH